MLDPRRLSPVLETTRDMRESLFSVCESHGLTSMAAEALAHLWGVKSIAQVAMLTEEWIDKLQVRRRNLGYGGHYFTLYR